jgi:hypothetical protein
VLLEPSGILRPYQMRIADQLPGQALPAKTTGCPTLRVLCEGWDTAGISLKPAAGPIDPHLGPLRDGATY